MSSQSSKNISVWIVHLTPLILILWPQINPYNLSRWWMKYAKIFHQPLITSLVLSCMPAMTYTYQIASQTLNLCSSKSISQTLADTLAPAAPGLSILTFTQLSSVNVRVSSEDTVKGGISTCALSFFIAAWIPVSGVLTITTAVLLPLWGAA